MNQLRSSSRRADLPGIRANGPRWAHAAAVAGVLGALAWGAATAAGADALTLDAAVQRALARNYTIRVESYLVPIARAGVLEATARFDPRLSFSYFDGTDNQPQGTDPQTGEPLPPAVLGNARYAFGLEGELPLGLTYQLGGNTSNGRGTFDDPSRPDYDYFATFAGVSARLPLLRGFGPAATQTTIRIARTDVGRSEWEFRATVINTVTNVVYAFDELLFAEANLRSARRSRELANGLYQENERRQQVGQMSEYDVLSARARVATREEGILLAERNLIETQNRLKQLISDDTSSALLQEAFELTPPPAPAEVTVRVDDDLNIALAARPDYQQARLALERNEYSQRFYRNQLLPAVDLVGSYGYNGVGDTFASSRSQITNRDFPSYSAGITLSVPLTSAAERARYRSARLARERSEVALRQLEQDIVVRVGNAAGQIETSWKRVLATRASRELSEQTLEAEVKKLRAGTGSTFIVLQLQEILSTDEVREARAVSDYRNALAEYDRQLGRTLQVHHVDLNDAGVPGAAP